MQCFILCVAALWLTVSAACASATASASNRSLQPTYARQTWLEKDGLPESTVQAFALDSEGYLWIGTTAGLVRFDGYKFLVYNRDSTPALPENSVFSLLSTSAGDLLVGTEGGGLVMVSHGRFRTFGSGEGLTDGFVRSLYEDKAHRIWVGTDNGVFLFERDHLVRIGGEATRDLAVHAITEDASHRIWVGGSSLYAFSAVPNGSAASSGWKVVPYRLEGVDSQNRVKSLLATYDGTILVGTVGGLEQLIPHSGETFRSVPGLHATVRTLAQTSDGQVLIGTIGNGLWSDRYGVLTATASASLLPSRTVLAIFEDRMKQLWIGTQNGMVRLSTTPVSIVPLPGASDPDFATISCDRDNTEWVSSSRLYRITQGVAAPATLPGLPPVPIRNVFRAGDGSLWVGTDGDGVYHLAGTRLNHLASPGQLTNNFVRAMLQASDGSLWIGTDDGLNHVTANSVVRYEPADGLAHFSIRALLEDRQHDLWIGTEQGLSHWHDGRFVADRLTQAMQHEKLWSLLEDRSGALWLGTRDHGLFRWNDGRLRHYTVADGLASDSIYQILQDSQGTLWISSPNRIFSVRLPAAADVTVFGEGEGRRAVQNLRRNSGDLQDGSSAILSQPFEASLQVTTYEMPFDADGTQMYGGRQSSGCIDSKGSIWFPSTRGALRVQPPTHRITADPIVHIDTISAAGRIWNSDGARIVVPAGASRTEFTFSALLLRPQEDLRFRYRLDPLDKDWISSGVARSAAYTNLPSGHYRFRVQVDQAGHFGTPGEASVEIYKQPYIYERWWFLLLVGLLVILMVGLIYRIRTHQLRLRFEAVLEERTRLAREMHDTVIQGCTSVSALLEAMACAPAALSSPTSPSPDDGGKPEISVVGNLLDHARAQVRTTIQEARDAVWDLRHSEHGSYAQDSHDQAGHDLGPSIEGIAAIAREEFQIAIAVCTEGRPVSVADHVAHQILMVVREAVYNAVQHGNAALTLQSAKAAAFSVGISIRFSRSTLTIEIRDTGCGFDVDAQNALSEHHYGIVGMKERMRHLGGSLRVNSLMGEGTVVTLQMKCSQLLRRSTTAQLETSKGGSHADPS